MSKKQSDLSRAFKEDGALKTHVGGQALIEGIMMRGKYNWSVAVREPSGSIYTEEHDLESGKSRNSWMYWPLVRGCRALVESLMLGYKALEIAAIHSFVEIDDRAAEHVAEGAADNAQAADAASNAQVAAAAEESATAALTFVDTADSGVDTCATADAAGESADAVDAATVPATDSDSAAGSADSTDSTDSADSTVDSTGSADSTDGADGTVDSADSTANASTAKDTDDDTEFGAKEMAVSMALGVVLGVGLFIVAPAFITNLLVGAYDEHTLLWNIVDGILRVFVFVLYIWLIGRMQEIKRMFGYHGAEHKTIHCYEHGLELTPENARSFPRLHVRCGTAFLIMVMVIAIVVYTVVPIKALIAAWGVTNGMAKLALVIVSRIVLMPVIAGLSYEITVRWAGSHPDNPLVKVILWPGMQMQYLTTNEPDDGQIECAIEAMKLVLLREEREEAAEKARTEEEAKEGVATEVS